MIDELTIHHYHERDARACILVGNGTSLMDKARGVEIDSYGCVVRFNLFDLGRYEPHTGRRCDVWFTVHPAHECGWRADLPWQKIFTHSWHREACPVASSFAAAERIRPESLALMSLYAATDYTHWSTGAIAAWRMAHDHGLVTLTGFDWWEREAHHYHDQSQRGTLHKPEIEREFFRKLEADGRLRWL